MLSKMTIALATGIAAVMTVTVAQANTRMTVHSAGASVSADAQWNEGYGTWGDYDHQAWTWPWVYGGISAYAGGTSFANANINVVDGGYACALWHWSGSGHAGAQSGEPYYAEAIISFSTSFSQSESFDFALSAIGNAHLYLSDHTGLLYSIGDGGSAAGQLPAGEYTLSGGATIYAYDGGHAYGSFDAIVPGPGALALCAAGLGLQARRRRSA